MPLQNPAPGLNNVGSFQVSGQPWAKSGIRVPDSGSSPATPAEIIFPYVTKFVTIKNDGVTDIRVGFSARGCTKGDSYFTLESGSSYSGDWKITRLYLMSDTAAEGTGSIVAGLTNINTDRLDRGTGDGQLHASWSGSEGVG